MKRMLLVRRLGLPVLLGALLVGCESDDHGGDHPPSSSGAQVGCDSDPRVQAYVAGLSAADPSGGLSAEIMSAEPAPPIKGTNTWTVRITANGQPPAPEEVKVTTLMPDHGHGSARIPEVKKNEDGTFTVTGIYLFMGGVWEVAFVSGPMTAKFTLCVQ